MPLTAVAFNCTLKRSPEPSSCGLLLSHFAAELEKAEIPCEIVRVADFDVKPGVSSDEGEGDEWPGLREKVLDADIFVMGTPIWLGHPSSICQRVLERFDAFLSEVDDSGRMITYDKVAVCAVVGNEDRGAPRERRGLPGTRRRRLHDPSQRLRLLDRRGIR